MDMGMMACGGSMMGQPGVVGAGVDCNNYLDVRDEHHVTDQGTVRIDHIFSNSDTLSARYSLSSEHGFMPINLPGFGTSHDDFSQQGSLAWNRIITPNMVNIAALTFSRLSMSHFTQSAFSNDIVSQLGILGIGFGGPGAWGAPWFNVQGFPAWATPTPPPQCGPGTQLLKGAIRSTGSTAATVSSSAEVSGVTSGPCGDFSRIAATTSSPTATLRKRGLTTARAQRWPVFCLGFPL